MIGAYEGVGFVETPRLAPIADAGAAAVDVYQSLIVGNECLAAAYSRMTNPSGQPTIVLGPVTDKLKRFQPIGWYWLGGYKRFREESIVRIESSSSLGANV
jgi:N4-gp56 family major capsid protein